ncbi:MAG: hypothetical protein EA363_06950 [Balneolaceae bacterium]|nr:MAG: hypothetical protein EA363_06950 [Balneolaceae bacterium]
MRSSMLKITPDYESILQNLTPGQVNELEMHSFINLMNVIYAQLELLLPDGDKNPHVKAALEQTRELLAKMRDGSLGGSFRLDITEYKKTVQRTVESLANQANTEESLADLRDARSLLEQTFSILDARLEELYRRIPQSGEWVQVSVDAFREEYHTYFKTQEKNSRGRYRIVMDAGRKRDNDYLVVMDVASENGSTLAMPLLFKDVIRDLVSNARKYTLPGGTIRFEIRQQDGRLRLLVSDTGIGIPEKELPRVFEHGYRASNAGSIRTMGGGFGLTKALHVVRKYQGDLWIESGQDNGTTIAIELPLPEHFPGPKRGERRTTEHEKEI